jgi:hypothetical protein
MESRLKRAARAALKPNAVITGVATGLFGWAAAESLRPHDQYEHLSRGELLFLSCTLLVASAALATKRPLGDLLAAFLCSPLPLIHLFLFASLPSRREVTLFSAEHIGHWLRELAAAPFSVWLMTALSFAILFSAVAATLRRSPSPS